MSGLTELAYTLGLIVLIWLAGALLIRAADSLESRRAAARHAHQRRRRAGAAAAPAGAPRPRREPHFFMPP